VFLDSSIIVRLLQQISIPGGVEKFYIITVERELGAQRLSVMPYIYISPCITLVINTAVIKAYVF